MATLNFPANPVNGQVYPPNPLPGQNVYFWDSTYQTWRLIGTSTGVASGIYGSSTAIPQLTIDASGRITVANNVPITPSAALVTVDPPIGGETNVQAVLEDAIYSVSSPNLSVVEGSYGAITISLPDTPVSPGFYSNASFTVDPQGRIISASSGSSLNVDVTEPITNTGTSSQPVIGILPASTTQAGAVQLNDSVTSTATDLALTAAQGSILQGQINALTVAGNLSYAGSFDASTSQMITVTLEGADAGFTVGSNLLPPSTSITDKFVIISVPGVYTPPGGVSPINLGQGDWLFCNGINWVKINIGANIPYASTTSPGAVTLSTNLETQVGTDSTKAITPAALSSRTATESRTGLSEVATQAEVNAGVDDSRYVTPLKLSRYISGEVNLGIPASKVVANPPINGQINLQDIIQDAIYSVSSTTLTVFENATGKVNINLPTTTVTAGSYTNASVTVDSQGRLTAASSGVTPTTNVVSPLVNTGTTTQPVIEILAASTSQSGAVQLNDTLISNATNLALTAAQGKVLQDQINVLAVAGNLSFSGTFNASTSQMVTVTIDGANAGFTVGADLPPPSLSVADHFVIVTTPGTYTPPGGSTPLDMGQGSWLFCNGTDWVKVDLASKVPSASETSQGVVRLATAAETQAGTDSTPVITPATLSSRTATETRTGLAEIATQAEVDLGADDLKFVTPLKLATYISNGGGGAPASSITVSPTINGNSNVQSVLEDAIYNVASTGGTITVTEAATGQVDLELPSTGVTPGSYDYATISVDAQGRVTLASTNTLPVASTSTPGIVQLVDDTVTNDNTQALTASAGVSLQQQIDTLASAQSATFVGTLNATTGLLLSVTPRGAAAGFAVGSPLPAASPANEEYFVVVTVPGSYAPPGGASVSANDGDWFVSNGSAWSYFNVGPTPAYVQFDDVSAGFNGSQTVFNLSIGGGNYAPVPSTNIMVFLGGIAQVPGAAYSVSGNQLTFTEAPLANTSFYATTVRSA